MIVISRRGQLRGKVTRVESRRTKAETEQKQEKLFHIFFTSNSMNFKSFPFFSIQMKFIMSIKTVVVTNYSEIQKCSESEYQMDVARDSFFHCLNSRHEMVRKVWISIYCSSFLENFCRHVSGLHRHETSSENLQRKIRRKRNSKHLKGFYLFI